jgi:hypothetical protein
VAWTTEAFPLISAQKKKNRSPAHQPLKIWPHFSQFKKSSAAVTIEPGETQKMHNLQLN